LDRKNWPFSSPKRHSTWPLWWWWWQCHDLGWNRSLWQNKPRHSERNAEFTDSLWGNRGSWSCAVSEPGEVTIFQQDNARPYTARQTQGIIRHNNIDALEWPTRSLDLSPIEHVWDILGQCLTREHNVHNVADFSHLLQQDWNQTTIHKLQKLIIRIRRHCMVVVADDGGHTKFWIACEYSHFTPFLFL
jgi:hypothetical protein